MTTSLQLGVVAIGTILLTTSVLADDPKPFQGVVLVAPTGSSTTPTLVQQLTAKLAYQLEELEEYPNNTYYGPASKRTAKQLAAAIAAAAAGTPMPPMLSENGGVVPLSKFGGSHVEASATPVPYAAGPLRVAKSLAAATGEGTPSLTPDTGLPSANPDTGLPSTNPDGGITTVSALVAKLLAAATGEGTPSLTPDTGLPSTNPDGGSTPVSSTSSARSATAVASATGGDDGTASPNPDSGAQSSNPDGRTGATGGG